MKDVKKWKEVQSVIKESIKRKGYFKEKLTKREEKEVYKISKIISEMKIDQIVAVIEFCFLVAGIKRALKKLKKENNIDGE